MTDKASKFMEMISSDENLKFELTNKLSGLDKEAQNELLVSVAKEKGFDLDKSDFSSSDNNTRELSMDELAQVSGGGGCGCAAFGAGAGDDLQCGCFGVGTGTVGPDINSQGGCVCVAGGAGATNRH